MIIGEREIGVAGEELMGEIKNPPIVVFDAKKENLKRGTSPPKLLKIGQAAKELHVSVSTLRRWDKQEKIKSIRLGPRGDRRFLEYDVKRLLREDGAIHESNNRGGISAEKIDEIENDTDSQLLSTRQVAELLNVHPNTVRRMGKNQNGWPIQSSRVGPGPGVRIFSQSEINNKIIDKLQR